MTVEAVVDTNINSNLNQVASKATTNCSKQFKMVIGVSREARRIPEMSMRL
jgi:hypothetical protein